MLELPIYWINLQHRGDRRSRLLQQFSDLNITNHVRISAIKDNPINKAIILSHIHAMATAWYDGCEYAMICEDDIDITKDSLNRCSATFEDIKSKPINWEILQLHYIEPHVLSKIANDPLKNMYVYGNFMSCACYIITRKGIRNLLEKVGTFDESDKFTEAFEFKTDDIPDMLIYRYLESYVCLYPAINTYEVESDNPHDNGWTENIHIKNMNTIAETFDKSLWALPSYYGTLRLITSWFPANERTDEFLNNYCRGNDMPKIASFLHGSLGEKLFQLVAGSNIAKSIEAPYSIYAVTESEYNKYLNLNNDIPVIVGRNTLEGMIHNHANDLSAIKYLSKAPRFIFEEPPKNPINVDSGLNILCGDFANQMFVSADNSIIQSLFSSTHMQEETDEIIININIYSTTINSDFIDLNNYYSKAIAEARTRGYHKFLIISSFTDDIEVIYPSLAGISSVYKNSYDMIKYSASAAGVIAANTADSWWAAWLCKGDFKTIPSKWNGDAIELQGAIVVPV